MNCYAPTADVALRQSNYLAEVLVATTWECNLDCRYCFVHQRGLSDGGECMPPELATRVVDALDEGLSYVETICLHLYGGEPLLNLPAMEAMVKRAGEKRPGRFRFAITTNGTCASKKALDLLRAGKFQVVLSIDGPAQIHDSCRVTPKGGVTHHKVKKFLKEIKAAGCWTRGSSVVRSGWSLAQAGEYLRALPVDVIKAQAVRLSPGSSYALTDLEKHAYLKDLEGVGLQVIAELEAGRPPKDDRFSSRVLQLLKGAKRESFCGAGKTNFGIAPDGTVLPCVLMDVESSRLGHVSDNPDTWRSSGRVWRKAVRRKTRCGRCSAFSLCGGGCQALMPFCGDGECEIIRKNCEVAAMIFENFKSRPESLLALAGIT